MTEATTKFKRYLYKRDGQEMISLARNESVSVTYALLSGRTTIEEVSALRQAMKEEKSDA